MDPNRIDALARALSGASTRRAALAGALAALLPLAGSAGPRRNAGRADGPASTACLAAGQRCGKGSGKRGKPCAKCCSRHSVAQPNGRRRCACKPAGTKAGNPAQCCAGRLWAGGVCAGIGCGPDEILDGGVCRACQVVCSDGDGAAACGEALQAAIADAPAGATVRVCPGSYLPPALDGFRIERALTLVGAGSGVSGTVLDADEAGRVLEIYAGSGDVVLRDLRIANGNRGTGGGIFTGTVSHLEIVGCTLIGNEAGNGGALLVNSGVTASLTDCLVENNEGSDGAGIFNSGGTLVLTRTAVSGNVGGISGGISSYGGEVTVGPGSSVTGNSAPEGLPFRAGGIFGFQGATITVDPGATVAGNTPCNCSEGIDGCAGPICPAAP